LTRLAGEDFVAMTPRVGFSVRELTVKEVQDLYPIRATLDPWALKLSGIPPRPIMRALETLNRDMSDAVGDVARIIEIDDRFHMELVGRCPNQVLLNLIRQMMWRTRRYEHLYFIEARHVAEAAKTHRALLARLRVDDLDGACEMLRENMQTASPALLAAIEARTARKQP
jgi:DNA-binding GntR family transcriptional regulator